jgi:hypothetical protein
MEDGRTMWFSSMERATEYLNNAGKPVPGKDGVIYDEPCEHRWNYVVIEKVHEGFSINEVMGWYEAIITGHWDVNGFKKLDKAPWDGAKGTCNFTGIGS